eukprot:TRINITY_DN27742_c0_g1_i7.p1 TRINITY_DN27742_c0_g1~~TRINITY_DN27742_c0_g1_i7.p1  ORF type:complete len:311 (+),score=36.25 TRINITY_DN27742_c0_g1_i7:184-1116(+)
MDMQHSMPPNTGCSGQEVEHGGGSWEGHILPGILFFSWGVWILLNVLYNYVSVQFNPNNKSVKNRAWYPLKYKNFPLEPLLVILGTSLGIPSELVWSNTRYTALLCRKGTKMRGMFDAYHINRWQHASIYPGFWLAAAVDLMGLYIKLPEGLEHVMLILAHTVEYVIMASHTKHIPMDARLHQLWASVVFMTIISIVLEMRFSENFMVGLLRPYFLILQGTWMFAIARTMFEDRKIWSTDYAASYSMVTVLFCWHLLGIMLFILVVLVALVAWQERCKKCYKVLQVDSRVEEISLPIYTAKQPRHAYNKP